MPVFPMFVDLKGKRCVVVGGGNVAARKIEALMAFGPAITVVSPNAVNEIVQLADMRQIDLLLREYREDDLSEAFVAIAASDDEAVNESVYNSCVKRGIMVNTVDDPEKCTFIFPAIVRRGDLVVGVSTSGRYPSMSKKVRQHVGASIPPYWGEAVDLLEPFRVRAKEEIKNEEKRKRALREIMDEALSCYEKYERQQLLLRLERIFEGYADYEND
ncbi:precorrin-2 dehydrogenase [Anaerobacterium chartisolvens]|uniref:precorrin-2 dehydrogenase n=1 Tax=Anaerobacterium chartisolvens TaxID=1297424 RepID=A0A369B817_9FIRM|nr:bifunctional precorrin-2 dehydrogenase/sirohydrochlorin ferrochelatase [Anaerobacterium chartisolvens]RCX17571.1 precorrin-2 dehydrogenase [Anaerobacterium chartisolvens]